MSKFLVNLDLVKNELQNARIQNLSSDPSSPVEGQIYFNTTAKEIRVYNGTIWEAVGLNGVTADAAEINILDGATLSTAELNLLDGVTATTAELNILDGVTATFTELNLLDGVTATTVELNYVDGVTSAIQTQLDAKAPLSNPEFTGTIVTPSVTFEGATANDFETTLGVVDPTADRAINLPDAAGTVALVENKLTDFAAPTSSLSLNTQKITGLADPTDPQDAATKAYVDAARSGMDVKESVRVATTATGNLSTAFANGAEIDGVTIATGNRILIKNQSTGSENGIYTVNASGAPTRATDANTSAKVTAGMFTFVSEGTVNGNAGFVLTTDDAITLDDTALTFTQFSGAGQIIAGNGLSKSGNTLSALADGSTLTIGSGGIKVSTSGITSNELASDSVIAAKLADASVELNTATVTGTLPVANGGTGGTTAATARAGINAAGKYSVAIGDGAATSYTITHNLDSRDVIVTVYKNSADYEVVYTDVAHATANTVTVAFASAPTTNQYKVVVLG